VKKIKKYENWSLFGVEIRKFCFVLEKCQHNTFIKENFANSNGPEFDPKMAEIIQKLLFFTTISFEWTEIVVHALTFECGLLKEKTLKLCYFIFSAKNIYKVYQIKSEHRVKIAFYTSKICSH
jgi:hypothetical protein